MRSLSLKEVLILHNKIIEEIGGSKDIRDLKSLESSLVQPFMTFDNKYLYKTIIDKAVALGYSLIMNHPFIDGNKRVGHAAIEIFLYLNGYELICKFEEQEKVILELASGNLNRSHFKKWVKAHVIKRPT